MPDFTQAELGRRIADALRRHCGPTGQVHRYRAGATIAQRGQPVRSVLLLRRGRMKAIYLHPDGREQFLAWTEPGEAAGIASVLCAVPLQVDLIAEADGDLDCEVQTIAGDRLEATMRADPQLALDVARFLSLRLTDAYDRLAGQGQQRLQDRLYDTLVLIGARNGQRLADGRIALRMTQQAMSDAVMASRQRVGEALHQLQAAGEIELSYRRIVLRPTARYRRTAGQVADPAPLP